DADIIRIFYETESVKVSAVGKLRDRYVVGEVVDKASGEVILGAGERITEEMVKVIQKSGMDELEVIKRVDDPLILNTLAEDPSESHDDALLRFYVRLRPGSPLNIEKAKQLFYERFFDPSRYRLGLVGRFRFNRKLEESVPETEQSLRKEDVLSAIRYLLKLRKGEGIVDDIDHLGNRRVRTIGELVAEDVRKGFLRLKKAVQERMSMREADQCTPRMLLNSKTVAATIEHFFARGELSQVVEQTNPLAQLTHERKLSALGQGGLNRKRAGFEVRDVHLSHYGRICPIETPEGTNIGLISSIGIYAHVDKYGFLTTPYRKVKDGKPTSEVVQLRADQEERSRVAMSDLDAEGKRAVADGSVLARYHGDFKALPVKDVEYIDVSPKQMVGISASLIPFLEHSDANRALMGSNMQRQAVPLLRTEPPLVATGMEPHVARYSGMVVTAQRDGVVKKVTANEVVIDDDVYEMRKFVGLNEGTCLNQKPVAVEGQRVKAGDIVADGAGTCRGELALGRNVLVAFMTWDGYNFEDAIIISDSLVEADKYTSIHIEEFTVEVRETKLGKEEFTRDIPNVPERALRNLDENGIVRVGTAINPGDILVGKVSPKSRSERTPEEKLLYAIFGRAGEDVKNDSLEVPAGTEGIVIETQRFSRQPKRIPGKGRTAKEAKAPRPGDAVAEEYDREIAETFLKMFRELEDLLGKPLKNAETGKTVSVDKLSRDEVLELEEDFDPEALDIRAEGKKNAALEIYRRYYERIDFLKDDRERRLSETRREGDELPPGVLEMVRVYIATKRRLSVGDKMAGRHGNKGVIAKILPKADMPFLDDGRPVEILLNPLGVPSRMNVGQILETHLGWAAKALGFQAVTPVFDGASEEEIRALLRDASLPEDGKTILRDGRSGEPFDQKVTVGYIYMMKLHHLVDDKVHARATGPYSLITQQPLGGKARMGGQRFGEMEVWALEAYGASHILQELLTVKSDDVEGRSKIYEAMVKGQHTLEAGTPVSFEVLTSEIKGLGLNMQLEKRRLAGGAAPAPTPEE
ncbi:MAG: DNA-directed RNA polymerase subunit beta, partial [Planctomycetes bacterium]|nr:DNA-directed RNA polymerase subunit beta [Planctomycetota bacterium]